MSSERTHASRPTWIVVVGLCLLPVYLWVLDGMVADLFFNAVVGAMLIVGLLVTSGMPRHRAAWAWILAGQVCFLFGDLGFNYVTYFTESEANYSFADVFYLSGYPCTAIGLVLLLRMQTRSEWPIPCRSARSRS